MDKNNTVAKRIANNTIIIPVVVFVVLTAITHLLYPIFRDDVHFMYAFPQMGFIDFSVHYYNVWSSRVIILAFLWVLSHSWWGFIATNIVATTLIYYFTVKVFADKQDRNMCWVCLFFIFMFPFAHMATAGFMATSVNYLWSVTFILVTGYGIKKAVTGTKIKIWEHPIYIISLIIAVNAEQVNALMLGILVLLLGHFFVIKKRVNYYLVIQLLITIAMLVFALQNPGNANRSAAETASWFPEYGMFGIFERAQLGYAFVLSHFIFNPNLVFSMFSLLLYTTIHLQYKDNLYRLIAAVPLGSSILFGVWQRFLPDNAITWLSQFGQNSAQVVNVSNFYNITFYVPLVMLGMVVLCVLVSVFLSFKAEQGKGLFYAALVALGFAVSFIMGFSPTVWASGARTLIFTYFTLIMCMVMFYQKIRQLKFKHEYIFFAGFGLIAAYSYVRFLAWLMLLNV